MRLPSFCLKDNETALNRLKDIETGSLADGEFTRRLSQSRYI